MSTISTFKKEDWPEGFTQIPQPPEKLYIEGAPLSYDAVYLCVVGSRKFTSYGKEVCEMLIEGLGGLNVVIVSGLAVGIDAIAHKAALKNGLRTVAIPGSGLSRRAIYPHSNARLADEIVAAGGTLISEYEPNFLAMLHTFPERNRLMVALSKAVLIIEAGRKSGTLITARLATEYNKDLLVVPGSIYSKNSEGSHQLLKQGAGIITNVTDLIEALGFEQGNEHQKTLELEYANCSEAERDILEGLREPIERDELIRISGKLPNEVNSLLGILEIRGLIKESAGLIHLT